MPVLNTTATGNVVTVDEAGTYKISYAMSVTPGQAGTIETYVQAAGTELPESTLTYTNATASTPFNSSNSVIANLQASDTVGLYLESSATDTVALSNATLTVEKISTGTPAA